jgi:hypothetical protein
MSAALATLAIAAVPAFVASVVEWVEAFTIVLAVGNTRGWRSWVNGSLAGKRRDFRGCQKSGQVADEFLVTGAEVDLIWRVAGDQVSHLG